jgi:hypothetical protein
MPNSEIGLIFVNIAHSWGVQFAGKKGKKFVLKKGW